MKRIELSELTLDDLQAMALLLPNAIDCEQESQKILYRNQHWTFQRLAVHAENGIGQAWQLGLSSSFRPFGDGVIIYVADKVFLFCPGVNAGYEARLDLQDKGNSREITDVIRAQN